MATYKIKPGETLSEIAKRLKTTVSALQKANGIKNANRISAGATIKYGSSSSSKKAPAKKAPAKLSPIAAQQKAAADKAAAEKSGYNNSSAKKDADYWRNAGIDDLAKKYGFDYSRKYANDQAASEARAKFDAINAGRRDNKSANENTTKRIQQGVVDANNSLDHSFFQQMMSQAQSAADGGMNGGVAGDQNLRLGMNKQAQLSSVYGEANQARTEEMSRFNNNLMSFNDEEGTAKVEQLARSNSLFQELREQGFANLLKQRDNSKGYSDTAYDQMMDRIALINDNRDSQIGRINDESGYSGYYNGKRTDEAANRDRSYNLDRDKFAYQKAEDARQRAAQAAAARAYSTRQSGSPSRSSSPSSPKSGYTPVSLPFLNAKKSSGSTGLDKYNAAQRKIYNGTGSPRKPLLSPVRLAQDKSLSPWQKMKIFGG